MKSTKKSFDFGAGTEENLLLVLEGKLVPHTLLSVLFFCDLEE